MRKIFTIVVVALIMGFVFTVQVQAQSDDSAFALRLGNAIKESADAENGEPWHFTVSNLPNSHYEETVDLITEMAYAFDWEIEVDTDEDMFLVELWNHNYEIKKGDTLWSIAKKHNITVNKILELNPNIKNPNLIFYGKSLRIE